MAKGKDERFNPNRRIISPDDQIWVDGEPFSRAEIHQAAGFTERTPEYLLEKHKEKQRRRNG